MSINKIFLNRQVVEGSETLNKLEEIDCQNQRPLKEILIEDCGIYKFEF